MNVGPSLSRLERERITDAAKLAASGVSVKWRNIGRRVSYVVAGKDHLVLTSQSGEVHAELCRQVAEEFKQLEEACQRQQ